jgi:hypothetical protein
MQRRARSVNAPADKNNGVESKPVTEVVLVEQIPPDELLAHGYK